MNNTLSIKPNLQLTVRYCTDKGKVRPNNEDYCGFYIPDDEKIEKEFGSLFVISDGVGGSRAGEVASSEAVNVLLQEYFFGDYSQKCPERLKEAFQMTALHIYDLSETSGSCNKMMCTLSALLMKGKKFYISHVGDSKIYLLRGGKLVQLTKDQTIVGKMLRMGLISREQAKIHPSRHVLLHSLGERPILPADFYSGFLQNGDLFFLCTDGVLEHLAEEEIEDFLSAGKQESDGIGKLIELANSRGGEDNMTVMTVDPGLF